MKTSINELRELIAVYPMQYFTDDMFTNYRRKGYEVEFNTKENAVRVFGYDKQTEYSMRGFWEYRR